MCRPLGARGIANGVQHKAHTLSHHEARRQRRQGLVQMWQVLYHVPAQTWQPRAEQRKVLAGADVAGAHLDSAATTVPGTPWSLGSARAASAFVDGCAAACRSCCSDAAAWMAFDMGDAAPDHCRHTPRRAPRVVAHWARDAPRKRMGRGWRVRLGPGADVASSEASPRADVASFSLECAGPSADVGARKRRVGRTDGPDRRGRRRPQCSSALTESRSARPRSARSSGHAAS